jgi:hypothetical protein
MVWSNESIIAIVTLFVTCVPLALLLWRQHKRRSHYSLNQGRHKSLLITDVTYLTPLPDIESTIELPLHRSNMHRTESFVLVKALIRSMCTSLYLDKNVSWQRHSLLMGKNEHSMSSHDNCTISALQTASHLHYDFLASIISAFIILASFE